MIYVDINDLYHIAKGDEFRYIDYDSPHDDFTTTPKHRILSQADSYKELSDRWYGIKQGVKTLNGVPVFSGRRAEPNIFNRVKAFTANTMLNRNRPFLYLYNGKEYTITQEEKAELKSILGELLKRYRCIQDMVEKLSINEMLAHAEYCPWIIPKGNTEFVDRFVTRYSGVRKTQAMKWLPRGLDDINSDNIDELTSNAKTKAFILNSLQLETMDESVLLHPKMALPIPVDATKIYFDIEFKPAGQEVISIAFVTGSDLFASSIPDDPIKKFKHAISYYDNPVLIHWSGVDKRIIDRELPDNNYQFFDLHAFFRDQGIATRDCYTRVLKKVHSGMFGDMYPEKGIKTGVEVAAISGRALTVDALTQIKKYNIRDCLMLRDIVTKAMI